MNNQLIQAFLPSLSLSWNLLFGGNCTVWCWLFVLAAISFCNESTADNPGKVSASPTVAFLSPASKYEVGNNNWPSELTNQMTNGWPNPNLKKGSVRRGESWRKAELANKLASLRIARDACPAAQINYITARFNDGHATLLRNYRPFIMNN